MPKHGSPGYQHVEQDDYSDGVLEEVWAWVERHGVDPHEEYQIAEDDFALLTIDEMLDAVLDRYKRAVATAFQLPRDVIEGGDPNLHTAQQPAPPEDAPPDG